MACRLPSFLKGEPLVKRVAVFVDAGYFWVQTAKALFLEQKPRSFVHVDHQRMRSELLGQVENFCPGSDLLRIYWYDGPGANGTKSYEHECIERLDDFKLRLGSRNIRGDQKAVDGLLIADVIGLAQNRSISEAIILSGDADLVPGVLAVQNLGIRVLLIEIGAREATSPYLIAEVDRYCRWNSESIRSFAIKAPSCEETEHSPSSLSLEPVSQLDLKKIAEEFYCHQSAEKRKMLATIDHNQPIPSDVDRALLELARTENGDRWLQTEQKKLIRSLLKEHAKLQKGK